MIISKFLYVVCFNKAFTEKDNLTYFDSINEKYCFLHSLICIKHCTSKFFIWFKTALWFSHASFSNYWVQLAQIAADVEIFTAM